MINTAGQHKNGPWPYMKCLFAIRQCHNFLTGEYAVELDVEVLVRPLGYSFLGVDGILVRTNVAKCVIDRCAEDKFHVFNHLHIEKEEQYRN